MEIEPGQEWRAEGIVLVLSGGADDPGFLGTFSSDLLVDPDVSPLLPTERLDAIAEDRACLAEALAGCAQRSERQMLKAT
jgi:hypothetical protein